MGWEPWVATGQVLCYWKKGGQRSERIKQNEALATSYESLDPPVPGFSPILSGHLSQ